MSLRSQNCFPNLQRFCLDISNFFYPDGKIFPGQLFARKENYQFEQYLFIRPCSW